MKEIHEMLKREIEKHWGSVDGTPPGLAGFIDAINKTYRQNDLERDRLERSAHLYRSVFENATIAAVVVDEDGTIALANPSFEKLSGYSKAELEKKKRWMEFLVKEEAAGDAGNDAALEGHSSGPQRHEGKFIDRAGVVKSCMNDISVIPGSTRTVVSVLDLTHMKRLQNQLVHAQKMEAIGSLASGVAHDFNNLLMGIQGHISLVLLDAQSDPVLRERLEGVEEHVRRGADLAKRLLSFAQAGRYQAKPISLNEVTGKTAAMFGRTRKEIAIHESFQEDLWTVEADQGEIERVLLNLFVNAGQAMPGGGELYLETWNVTLDRRYVQPFRFTAGRYVKISVTDTGEGMDEETKARIFEPFFTTREMGQGTGLGLTSAYAIVKGHRGIINVYSEKGRGTTFSIYLPASRKKKGAEEKPVPETELKGSGTILLVDDEPSILDVGRQVLELLGYKVFVAAGGREAIELFRTNCSRIDLVILDMIMPRVGGSETFDALKEIDPAVRVILSSGYSMNGEANRIMEKGCKAFIQKPFTPVELSKKIREVIG